MKILVTAFDAFGGDSINPSSLVLEKLEDNFKGAKIEKLLIPTSFKKASQLLESYLEKNTFDYIICLGQAGGAKDIRVERVAINIDDARIKDNDNYQPIDKKIRERGENAYFSSLPIKAMVKRLQDENIPASLSNSAGTFVCNHLMYEALYLCNNFYKNTKAGFVHIPYIKDQVVEKENVAYLDFSIIFQAINYIIETCIEFHKKEDIIKTMGEIF